MNLLLATQTVVVYRSLAEQRADEFWTDFLVNNPWLMYVFMGVFASFFLLVVGIIMRGWWNMRSFHKNFNKRWKR